MIIGHVVAKRVYFLVFAALMILLALTVTLAEVNLGRFNIVVALTIAVIKMLLVMLWFMHLRYSSHLSWAIAGAGFLWVVVMFALIFSDYLTRSWLGGVHVP